MPAALATLDFHGAKIRRVDASGASNPVGDFWHATDMWRAAGSPENKRPSDSVAANRSAWRRT